MMTKMSKFKFGKLAANLIQVSLFIWLHKLVQGQQDIDQQLKFKTLNQSHGHTNSNQLPLITSINNANEQLYARASEILFYDNFEEFEKWSISEFAQMGLVTLAQSSAYNSIYMHHYETYDQMRDASGPEVDQELCLRQLESMLSRVDQQERDGFNSHDFNIYRIMDTWGRVPSGLLPGYLFYEGAYDECLQSKFTHPINGTATKLRYCVLEFKMIDWQPVDKLDILRLSSGICIPKCCDSLNYGNKFQLISKLSAPLLNDGPKNQIEMTNLYCLPDEDSPLRSIWRSPKTVAVLVGLATWLSLLVYATYKFDQLDKLDKSTGQLTTRISSSQRNQMDLFRLLSITNNFKLLFDTKKGSSLLESPNEKVVNKVCSATQEAKDSATNKTLFKNDSNSSEQVQGKRSVDLRCIEGIKVIALSYVIAGHVVMCMPTIMRNGRQLAASPLGSLVFYTANLVPAFAVNSFFTITGLLTSYLLLKENKTKRVITSPLKWVAVVLYRYLRIMPMYALAVLYCKTLAKYTGSGPLWDYGTSALSQRRLCEQESWTWTLTFTSNFLPPLKHCIPGGWYLSNDFQFFLITPFYMALLYLKPQLGKTLLLASIAAGYLAGFFSIYHSQVTDFRPIANFLPSGFKTYVSHLSFNYTFPQYRIPAYLIGLLFGYELYQLEEAKRRYNQLRASEKCGQIEPCWPSVYKNYAAYLMVGLITFCLATPFWGQYVPFDKYSARWAVALVTPTYHVIFGSVVGTFIVLATTGHANQHLARLLSAPIWKPLARLSLCVLLINVEVINSLIQNSPRQYHVSNGFLIVLNSISILTTFLVAIVVCILFEAPIRASLNTLIARLIERYSVKQAAG